MSELNKKLLNRLRRDIFIGKKLEDLSIAIESSETANDTYEEKDGIQPEVDGIKKTEAEVYHSTDRMLCNLHSRSPSDIWTIKYKGSVIARGDFSELGNVLTIIPKQALSYRFLLIRQIIAWIGLIAILVLSFFAGITSVRHLPHLLLTKINSIEDSAELITKDVTNVKSSLEEITKRQDLTKSLLIAALTQLKSTGEAQPPISSGHDSLSQADEISAKLRKKLAEQDITEFLELESKKRRLAYRDLELENKNMLPSHPTRLSLIRSIAAIDQRLAAIKEKYGLNN